MEENQAAFTRERYDEICKRAEELGITIITKYRKGLENIRTGDIVLDENPKATALALLEG